MNKEGRTALSNVALMITERCNLHCSYCFQRFFESKFSEDSSVEVISRFIDMLASLRNDVKEFTLWGGEALLRPDLLKFAVDYAAGKIKVNCWKIGTNAILLNDNVDLVDGFDIYVSIDGTGKYNYRRTPEHVLRNKAWLKCKKSYVVCSPVCDVRKNNGNVVDQIKSLVDLGFKNFHIPMVLNNAEPVKVEELKIFEREYDKLVKMHLAGEINIGAFLGYKDPEHDPGAVWGEKEIYCWVDTKGNLFPTYFNMLSRENQFGDIVAGVDEDTVKDLAEKFGSYNESKCGKCKNKNICLISGVFNYTRAVGEKASYFCEGICAEYKAKARCYERGMKSEDLLTV